MITKEKAEIIGQEYLTHRGEEKITLVTINDKIYKWVAIYESETSRFRVDISKSDGRVLKLEKE